MKQKKQAQNEIKCNVVIETPANKIPPETLCFSIFGMSLMNIAREIRDNKNGKWDFLYDET